ncbi:hypothetical protein B0H17DRAFT_1127759 [Mycena rosella]|uniref:Uncharacterized protein n=1 Tax=Mycena rosella TaxID=1033263 RepID=A0AAD7GN54_MYCRO|nr:hypothetical protein B0H17DRAFT_1127759 [Mycena rosella]
MAQQARESDGGTRGGCRERAGASGASGALFSSLFNGDFLGNLRALWGACWAGGGTMMHSEGAPPAHPGVLGAPGSLFLSLFNGYLLNNLSIMTAISPPRRMAGDAPKSDNGTSHGTLGTRRGGALIMGQYAAYSAPCRTSSI